MTLLEELQKARDLFARCPHCEREFPLSKANLFDATKPLPPRAKAHLDEQREELREQRASLKRRRVVATTKPAISAVSSITGKVLEKIAPSLPGFPVEPADCRALFEPIDYVIFKGLSAKGKVDSLLFVDVKSGKARLAPDQREIKGLVEGGKVGFKIEARTEEAK